ncbi:DUF7288 family protein [Haloarcula nitratireducens]|uniref:DUF7288 family protein n=1 Tax=Haloarcula nitratireducens TaxID=2487749 RepID=UPI002E2A1F6A|nr:hypothetical protein [Halomicroarcula nitratireducens]
MEAFTAALLVLGAVLFTLQATAITPLTASTSNERVENQQRTLAKDLLTTTDANGALRDAAVFWDTNTGQFDGAPDVGFYASGGPPNQFGTALNETFRAKRIAFNVYVSYQEPDGSSSRETMVYMGTPSNHAVVATHTVPLFDDTQLTASGATQTLEAANASFYAEDVAPNSPLYTVTEVRLVVWQM